MDGSLFRDFESVGNWAFASAGREPKAWSLSTAKIPKHRGVDYIDRGVGLPIVFVPGLYGSASWFGYQVSGLSDRHRTIACATRSARGCADYSLELLADDLVRFLDCLKVYSAVFVGHTLGALVALKLAESQPERVLAVVCVSAAPSFSAVSQEDILSHLSPGTVEQEGYWARLWRRISGAKAVVEDESNPLAYLVHNAGSVDKTTLSARLRLLQEADVRPILPRISAPVLAVAGSNDWSRILAGSQEIDELVPGATLEVIEGADHFCFFTRHDLFNACLDDFITREVPCP